MNLSLYFQDVIEQNKERLKEYFVPDAKVLWHCTDECFTAEEFIRANCEYPGNWAGEIEILQQTPQGWVMAARVWEKQELTSFHVVSFFQTEGEKIKQIDEYWGDDGDVPEWRKEKHIGIPIHK